MSEVQELPQGWVPTTLGALGDYINGYPFNDKIWSKTGRPIIRIQNLTGTTKVTNYYDGEIDNRYIVHTGDLLVAWSATLGAFIWKGPEACLNQHIFKVTSRIDKLFHYYLTQSVLQDLYWQAHGSGMVHVTRNKFDAVDVMLPPLPEQQRIVEALEQQLSRLDAGVVALRSTQQKLKRYRASVLKAAVEGKLTQEWHKSHPEVEPASELLKRILQERHAKWEEGQIAKGRDLHNVKYEEPVGLDVKELSKLPEGWCWIRAEQLCDFITKGTTPAADKLYSGMGEIPFIKVYNLTNHGYLDFSVKPTFIDKDTHMYELARSKVFPGDILMNIVGPPLGKISVIPDIYPEWNINQAIAIFRPMSNYHRQFLTISLMTEQILFWAVKRAKTTAGQHNLTLEICRDLPLPLAPLAEQEQIVSLVEERLSIISTLESTIGQVLKRAERMRQSILHKAFTGKLVAQDPNDEPASVLLERIRREREEATTLQKLKQLVYKEKGKSSRKRVAESTQPYLLVDVPDPEPVDAQATTQGGLWD